MVGNKQKKGEIFLKIKRLHTIQFLPLKTVKLLQFSIKKNRTHNEKRVTFVK